MIWQALDSHGHPITSTIAEDEAGALRRLIAELADRPGGRDAYFRRWQKAGMPVRQKP